MLFSCSICHFEGEISDGWDCVIFIVCFHWYCCSCFIVLFIILRGAPVAGIWLSLLFVATGCFCFLVLFIILRGAPVAWILSSSFHLVIFAFIVATFDFLVLF